MTEKVFFKNSKEQMICGVFKEPNPKKEEVVVIIHGFSSTKDKGSVFLAEELAKINLNSFRIDLDNRGESEPKIEDASISNYLITVESTIDFVKKRGYNNVSLIGISFGGNVVLVAALRHQKIKRMALMSPAFDYPALIARRFSKDELDRYKKDGYYGQLSGNGDQVRIKFECIEDSKNYVMFGKVKDIKCPVLIIQGTKDEEINYKDSQRIVGEFPNAKLVLIEGANHNLAVDGDYSKGKEVLRKWLEKDTK